jgi:DNA-binding transcriptional MocR family regulator
MSYKDALRDLERDGERSLSEQMVAAFREAIASGELAVGEKLPPTRELAEIAGVNHLTAVRVYRRLRELGLVTSQVGRGTFVREAAAAALLPDAADRDGGEWQRYVLPAMTESSGDRAMDEMYRHSQARGLIPLSVGYPSSELFPFDQIRRSMSEALESHDSRALQYTDIAGLPELVEQVAALSAARGAPEEPADILITSGARQGLTLAARAVLRPGDAAACESPTFMGVLESLRATGARVLPVPVDEDGLDIDALEELLARQEIRLLAMQSRCHNPTGVDLSAERRTRLLELARRHGFFIVEDGIYGDLRFAGEDPGSLRREAHGHVIYVDSLSKLVGGGMRVGWVASNGPVRERLLYEKRADDMHSATLTQLALARFLAAGEYPGHLERARTFYLERRDALLEATRKHLRGLATVQEPDGGGHLWLTLSVTADEGELMTEAVRNGVTFVPGAAMIPEPTAGTHLRLSYGFLDPDQLAEGVRRLARAIRSMGEQPRVSEALPIA